MKKLINSPDDVLAEALKGVDAADEVDAALDAARALAQKAECVVAISGAVDAIVSVYEIIRVGGGAEML